MADSLRSPIPQIASSKSTASKTLPPTEPPPIPIPPSPDPRPTNPSSASLLAPPAYKKWSDLFATKPRNAGKFVPPAIKLQFSGHRLVPSEEMLSAGIEVWSRYLVGFFLDEALPFSAVSYQINKHWRPKGAVKVKSNGSLFFFHFALDEDRAKVLETDPLIISNKVFIVKEWDTSIGNNSARIRSVPVWLKMYDIPPLAWTQIGICYLATMVGKFLCMDENTEKLERLEYAKCMVEVNPDQMLPDEFTVLLPDETEHVVKVEYLWKPAICSKCKVFGHVVENCSLSPSKKDKDALKSATGVTTQEPIKLQRFKVRVQDRRREKFNIFKRKQAWKKVHTLHQEENRDKSVVKDNVEATFIEGLEDTEVDLFNFTLPPIDLQDASIGPITVLSGIPIAKSISDKGQNSEKGADMQNGNNDARTSKGLEDGEISQLDEETGDELEWLNSVNVHEKTDTRQMVDGHAGNKAADNFSGLNACESVDSGVVVKTHVKAVGDNSSNKIGESVQVIEIARVNEMLNAAFPSNRESKELPTIQVRQLEVLNDQCKEKDTEMEALIKIITDNMQQIGEKLQAELDKREVNTKQFYATKRTMKDFEDFKLRNSLDQMDKARLDGVADIVKQMVVSVNNRGQTTPTTKSKNPYAHLTAPPAYKERPPDIVTDPVPTSSNEKAGSKTPITRSRKKEMLRNLQENG